MLAIRRRRDETNLEYDIRKLASLDGGVHEASSAIVPSLAADPVIREYYQTHEGTLADAISDVLRGYLTDDLPPLGLEATVLTVALGLDDATSDRTAEARLADAQKKASLGATRFSKGSDAFYPRAVSRLAARLRDEAPLLTSPVGYWLDHVSSRWRVRDTVPVSFEYTLDIRLTVTRSPLRLYLHRYEWSGRLGQSEKGPLEVLPLEQEAAGSTEMRVLDAKAAIEEDGHDLYFVYLGRRFMVGESPSFRLYQEFSDPDNRTSPVLWHSTQTYGPKTLFLEVTCPPSCARDGFTFSENGVPTGRWTSKDHNSLLPAMSVTPDPNGDLIARWNVGTTELRHRYEIGFARLAARRL